MSGNDTIIALSSGALPSGVAVIRLSGSRCAAVLGGLCGVLPRPRMASLRKLRDRDGTVIDEGLVLWFPAPASFTGEDCAELQLHGSRAVVQRVLEIAQDDTEVRLAEPGEFARRAFLNGRIDLTEAEGLSDLIVAETEAQRRLAQLQASGELSSLYSNWRDRLLDARAMLEADIDFADEDDVPGSVADRVSADLNLLEEEIAVHLAGQGRARLVRDGVRIALVGAPNAGKSSLLNALAGSDKAIVSDIAGTTRDVLEVRLDLGGNLVIVSDTAGLRESADPIEVEGIRRARVSAAAADIVLHLSETGRWEEIEGVAPERVWKIATKRDLGGNLPEGSLALSVRDRNFLNQFVSRLEGAVASLVEVSGSTGALQDRHIAHLESCRRAVDNAKDAGLPLELRAEALREAAFSLGRITGTIGVEDVLGRIFSTFCIGK